jgi:hypothetical protein
MSEKKRAGWLTPIAAEDMSLDETPPHRFENSTQYRDDGLVRETVPG